MRIKNIRLISLLLGILILAGLSSCSLTSRSDRDRIADLEEELDAVEESIEEVGTSETETEKTEFRDTLPKQGKGKIIYSMQTKNENNQEGKHNFELYIMDVDGSNPIRLTYSEDMHEGAPSISPDGSSIAFIRSYPDLNILDFVSLHVGLLSIMDIDGGNRQDFSIDACRPYFSEDSSTVHYFLPDRGIMSVRTDGTDNKVLFEKEDFFPFESKVLAQNNGYVFYRFDDNDIPQLFYMNSDGTNLRQLTDFEEQLLGWITISPDQKYIAFQSIHMGPNYKHPDKGLHLIDLENFTMLQLTDSNSKTRPVFSPDGASIYYTKDTSSREGLVICSIRTDGTSDRLVTSYRDPHGDANICVSDDGELIFYRSDNKLFRCNADGSNPVQLTEESTFHYCYAWIVD